MWNLFIPGSTIKFGWRINNPAFQPSTSSFFSSSVRVTLTWGVEEEVHWIQRHQIKGVLQREWMRGLRLQIETKLSLSSCSLYQLIHLSLLSLSFFGWQGERREKCWNRLTRPSSCYDLMSYHVWPDEGLVIKRERERRNDGRRRELRWKERWKKKKRGGGLRAMKWKLSCTEFLLFFLLSFFFVSFFLFLSSRQEFRSHQNMNFILFWTERERRTLQKITKCVRGERRKEMDVNVTRDVTMKKERGERREKMKSNIKYFVTGFLAKLHLFDMSLLYFYRKCLFYFLLLLLFEFSRQEFCVTGIIH